MVSKGRVSLGQLLPELLAQSGLGGGTGHTRLPWAITGGFRVELTPKAGPASGAVRTDLAQKKPARLLRMVAGQASPDN